MTLLAAAFLAVLAASPRPPCPGEEPPLGGTDIVPPENAAPAERADETLHKGSRITGPEEHDKILSRDFEPRKMLEEEGLTFDLVYTAEVFRNFSGGISSNRAGRYRGDVSLFVMFDTAAADLWEGGSFFAHVQHEHGDGITDNAVGDFQVLSNMDADDFTQVSEFWYLHTFLDGRLWAKVGKQDAAKDFAAPLYGGGFLNSSAGYSPTIPMTTYPDPDLGLSAGLEPAACFSLNLGVYQGRPGGGRSPKNAIEDLHGPMVMVEPAFHYRIAGMEGHLRPGAWWNEDRFDRLDRNEARPGTVGRSYGLYLTWDQEIWKDGSAPEGGGRCIGVFGQYGWTPPDRSTAEHYFGFGAEWTGPLPERDGDRIGLGLFQVEFSRDAALPRGRERAIELYYRIQVTNFLYVKPDVQYITNPGGSSNPAALAAGIRTGIFF